MTTHNSTSPSKRWSFPASVASSTFIHALFLIFAFTAAQIAPAQELNPIDTTVQITQATLTLPKDFLKPIAITPPEPKPVLTAAAEPAPAPAPAPKAQKPPPTQVKKPRLKRKAPKNPLKATPILKPQPDAVAKADTTPEAAPTEPTQDDTSPLGSSSETASPTAAAITGQKGGIGAGAPDAKGVAPKSIDTRGILKGYMSQIATTLRRSRTYPRAARRAGIQGTVLIELTINASGSITRVKVARSSGHSVLDDAAVKAVRAVGRLPNPPNALGWTQRSIRIPFNYALKHS